MGRRLGLTAHFCGLLLLVGAFVLSSVVAEGQTVTLYRDHFGVPSVEAGRPADALYGLGYAMAQDCAERMARSYKLARGRTAEADGRAGLLADGFLRALGIEDAALAKANDLSGTTGDLIRAFCDGANRALAEQKDRLPRWIEPFTPVDVLALAQFANAAFPLLDIRDQLFPGVGSNQFAIAPKNTASGHALLSIDPHLDWNGPLTWYEYAVYAPGLHFRGITVIGLPLPAMGHSDRVAWCMTNNDPMLYTVYQVETNPANPKQYRYHGEWRDFEDAKMELRYRDGEQLKTHVQTLRRTAWGPMLPFRSEAVRLSMIGSWDLLEQGLKMMTARDARQFRDALKMRGLSMWNLVYADTHGAIGYQYNARVPHRDESFDWRGPVSGADPRTKWGELWTLDELPHAENPASGLLVNANSSPWLTPLGPEIKPSGWPADITTYGHTTRYDRLAALLSADHHITVETAKRYATDTLVPDAPAVVKALEQAAPPLASSTGSALGRALEVLTAWNGRADPTAQGCALYVYWLLAKEEMPGLAEKAGRGESWTPAERAAALTALQEAAAVLQKDHGRLDLPWGEMHVSQHGKKTVPVSGFGYIHFPHRDSAVAAVVPCTGPFKDGRFGCTFGSSFRMIVDLDPKGVRSWSILPYGNASDPISPHYSDQMELFGRGEYKDTHFGLKNAQANAVSKTVLTRTTAGG